MNWLAHGHAVGNRSRRRPERFTITAANAIRRVRRVRFVIVGCPVSSPVQIPRLWASTEHPSQAALAWK